MLPTNGPRAARDVPTPAVPTTSEDGRRPTSAAPDVGESVMWDSAQVSRAADRFPRAPADAVVATKCCPHCGGQYDAQLKFCPQDGAVLHSNAAGDDLVGRVIAGRYHVIRELGAGGMGRVYLATHLRLGRNCALKVLKAGLLDDVEAIARFDREAANASRISHPHVAAVYDFGDAGDGIVYLAMELVEGAPLSEVLRHEPVLPPRRACSIIAQCADGLAAAHQLGIVHRDLKPDNIMLGTNRDGSDCVKIVDFGIAKGLQAESQMITATGFIIGTPAYMSPEQLAGNDVDARSDIYSLALVAFQLLAGALPYPEGQDALLARLALPPRTLAEVRGDVSWPARLQGVLQRALAVAPANRYAAVEEFSQDLRHAIDAWRPASSGGSPVAVASVDSGPSGRRVLDTASRVYRLSMLVTLAVVAVATATLGWHAFGSSSLEGRDKARTARDGVREVAPAPAPVAAPARDSVSPSAHAEASTHDIPVKDPPRVPTNPSARSATPLAQGTHESARHSLDRLRSLTDPLSGTDATARSALEQMPAMLATMESSADSIEAQYYAIQAHLLLGDEASACQTLRRIEPRAAAHPFLANAIKAIRADSSFQCP